MSHIPVIKAGLDLTNGELGAILLAGGLGALAGIPLAMWIARTAGSAKSLFSGALSILLLPLCGTKYLALGAVSLGFTCGVLDVSNSSHAVCLEKLLKSKIVGSMLAMNSFGNILGVLIGGVCDYCSVTPFLHFVALSATGSILSFQFYTFLVNFETEKNIMMIDTSFSMQHSSGKENVRIDVDAESSFSSFRMSGSLAEIDNDIPSTGPSYRSFDDGTSNDEMIYMDSENKNSLEGSVNQVDVLCGCHSQLLYMNLTPTQLISKFMMFFY